jgi:hypothetical protein
VANKIYRVVFIFENKKDLREFLPDGIIVQVLLSAYHTNKIKKI